MPASQQEGAVQGEGPLRSATAGVLLRPELATYPWAGQNAYLGLCLQQENGRPGLQSHKTPLLLTLIISVCSGQSQSGLQ